MTPQQSGVTRSNMGFWRGMGRVFIGFPLTLSHLYLYNLSSSPIYGAYLYLLTVQCVDQLSASA